MEEATENGRFKSVEILYEWLFYGHEYGFTYKGNEYFICNGFDRSTGTMDLRIAELNKPDVKYNSIDDLFDNFKVDGKSFREFMFEVEVVDEF